MHRGGAGLLALAIASGCASVDKSLLEAQTPTPPAMWASAEDETSADERAGLGVAPTGDWLAAFRDEQIRGLVAEAMLNNNTVLQAASSFDGAMAAFKVARADLLPELNATPSASRNAIVLDPTFAAQAGGGAADVGNVRIQDLEDEFGVDLDGDGDPDVLDTDGDGVFEPIPNRRLYINNYRLAASLSWEIDLWGRLSDQTRAARKDARAAEADLRAAQLSIAGAVTQGWFNLIEARQQRELGERDVQALERSLEVTERRYERGVSSSLDVRLARSAVGTSRATLATRRQNEKEAARRLEVLLGRYPAAEIDGAAALPVLEPLAGAGAPVEILARRPDIIAAELRMESAGLRARAARKQFLPSLTISSNINTSGPDLEDVIDPERLAGNIAAGLFQPLFQGGRIKANARRQRAEATRSLMAYAQTVLEAYEEAENAVAAESLLAAREEAQKFAFEEAAVAERITERRYANGAASIFNLLDAQQARIVAESSYLAAQRQRVANRVELYLAIGGDFLTDPALFSARTAPSAVDAEQTTDASAPGANL